MNCAASYDRSRLASFFEAGWSFLCRADKVSPLIILVLSALGVAGIYASGSFGESDEWCKQIVYIGIGCVAYVCVSAIDFRFYKRYANWIYLLGCALLFPIAVFGFFKIGGVDFIHAVNGAYRWYFIGSTSLQPSEFAKVSTLIFLAAMLSVKPMGAFKVSFSQLWRVVLAAGIPFVMVFVEPDLGSSLVYVPVVFALLFLANLTPKFFLTIGAAGALLFSVVAVDLYFYRARVEDYIEAKVEATGRVPQNPAAEIRSRENRATWGYEKDSYFFLLKDYQRERLLSFVDPETIDPNGIGSSWNVRQALISVGKGGLTGEGFNKGTQAKLGYLPELAAHNDFLFSVIAEEYGFAGCLMLVLTYGALLFRTVDIGLRSRDTFGILLTTGIAVMMAVHLLINIGMNIGIMPVTGLSLPFLSYGGSFVLSCFIVFGLVQSVHCHSKVPENEEVFEETKTGAHVQEFPA
ncbi:MAG: rod shape-determining protein RodA [Opitutales bacterium]|nr:rod shape-determining protein RodA [Opitutales bacterium]